MDSLMYRRLAIRGTVRPSDSSSSKSYISKMYEKLGASNRSQALVEAVRLGLLRVGAGSVARRAG